MEKKKITFSLICTGCCFFFSSPDRACFLSSGQFCFVFSSLDREKHIKN